ncbi:MAG TPA: LysR family transcriptional regulator [Kofleriaceae bacterium]|jgi:DNA-binding transcriptional LysR family regulator
MDLNRAHTFVRVVESGGFTRAAESLGLPPSSVSRAVSKLEEDLGITLLERTTRKVGLTDAGRAYFERARDALAGLAQASELAKDVAQEAYGTVRLAVPPDLAPQFGHVLSPFLAAHPGITVEVTFTNQGADLVGDLVDLAVAFGRLPDSSLVARKLGTTAHRLYASPAYLSSHRAPRTLAHLADHVAVVHRATAGEARWDLTGPRGVERVSLRARVVGDHMGFVLDAALTGIGIALLPSFLAAQQTDALTPILPRYASEIPLQLLAPGRNHIPHRVALLRDHLGAALNQQCTKHGA